MLLELIARYYKLLWLALAGIAFIKLIMSYIFFQGTLAGFSGILFGVFKWFGDDEQELEEFSGRRGMMRIHNIVTILFYMMLLVIVVATIIPMFITRTT